MATMRIPEDFVNDVKRSVHNLSLVKRTTFHPGVLYPIYSRKVLAGEKMTIDLRSLLNSMPLQSQLLGSFKLEFSVFFDSDANYYGWMDNNSRRSTEELLTRQRHRFTPSIQLPPSSGLTYATWLSDPRYSNQPHSLLDYAGYPVGAQRIVARLEGANSTPVYQQIDLGFVLTYMNIFRNYFANNQEEVAPYITKIRGASDSADYVGNFGLRTLDDLFMELRHAKDGIDCDSLPENWADELVWNFSDYLNSLTNEHGGLFLSTYMPDLYTNLLDNSNTAKSSVTVSNGSFDIDQLRFRNKLQRLIDRYDVSGGRFSGWLRSVWGVKTKRDMDIPEIIGVSSRVIDPSQTVSTAQTDMRELGAFGGNFDKYTEHNKKHSFYASTPGRVMVIMRLVPMVDYCQNLEPELRQTSFADDYNPEFAQKGFDKVSITDYTALPVFVNGVYTPNFRFNFNVSRAVGKQVSWLRLMTDVNRVHGLFASPFNDGKGLDSWVLQRRYSYNVPTGQDNSMNTVLRLTQYIYPLDYQYPFQYQNLESPNFQMQSGLDVKGVLPIGKRFMPNLE